MNFQAKLPFVALLVSVAIPQLAGAEPVWTTLFDGKTFDGWEGNTESVWRIEDGVIVGGSMEGNPQNEFLATTRSYKNFRLKLEYKLVGTEGFVNGGVQIRSRRMKNPAHEMIGYQADIGAGYSGFLYDESRRKKMLVKANQELVKKIEKAGEWNTYEIHARGRTVALSINGRPLATWIETDKSLEQKGLIALQIHGECKAVISFRNIQIEELPDPMAAPLAPAVHRFGEGATEASPNAPFPDGKFSLSQNEVVVFMGQTDMVRSRLDATLEAALATHFADQRPRFRNMAWESDTVYEQWRDIDFGSWEDQLAAVGASTVIAQFGQVEALEGGEKLDIFIAAYEKLLDQISKQTQRIALLSPRLFEKPGSPHMPDHRDKNAAIQKYSAAIAELAQRRSALFIDLSEPDETKRTSNGIHLTESAHPLVAGRITAALGVDAEPSADLISAVLEKNRLWFDNWRPMNWSFAFGDRTAQQFNKAAGGRPPLKAELETFKPLLSQADERIHRLANGESAAARPLRFTQPAPPPPGDHSPEAERASLRVRDGFEINLFASEADGLVKPVQMRWDDRGRLWVICTPTYPHIEPGLLPGDYILVCEDTDGDGKADKFDRFAEGLFIPMGLEFGDGGLYVTEATELVHLVDADDDGKADQRTVLLSGFGTADSHQMINGLERGPMGDLWFTQGHHAYSRVETPWGISRLEKAGVWRYRLPTGRLDGFFNLSKAGLNCQGVAHDDWGQTFHNSAAISGGFYTSAGAIATDRTEVLAPLTPDPSRNTGIEFIGTRHLPDDMQGDIIWGGYMSNTVQTRELIDDGSGFRAEKLTDLIQSDRQDFRPVNVKIGPDGAIYVCDWYNPTIGHYQASYRDPSRDRTHGRIWRITAKGRPLAKAP
ncbi:MAG: PVC-type heme-binding CxxCH protein, partial [Verrucomicrobiota bacterium]